MDLVIGEDEGARVRLLEKELRSTLRGDSEAAVLLQHGVVREAFELFQTEFGPTSKDELKASVAPGRVNLIGEHVDYCDGFVLPIAIPMYTVALGRLSKEKNGSRIYSSLSKRTVHLKKPYTQFDRQALKAAGESWVLYVQGVLALWEDGDLDVEIVVHSHVPVGAGLSSSAALEVASLLLFVQLGSTPPPKRETLALLAQRAEHEYAGMPCGIMDQFVVSLATPGHALKIDCRSLDFESIPLDITHDVVFLVTNTGVKHELGSSEYPKRKAGVDRALSILGLTSWRDVDVSQLPSILPRLETDEQRQFVEHVVRETARTHDASLALLDNNITLFGQLMTASHVSLRDLYRVSCVESDELVNLSLNFEGVFGSRMTGGGFGGCVVTLVRKDRLVDLQNHISENYSGTPTFYVCEAVGAARDVSLNFLE